jgi:toxin ParE1/3/4
MTPVIRIRPAARRDIDRLADHIGQHHRAAGRRFYDSVQQALQQLAPMPELGSPCELDSPRLAGLRVWSIRDFENYLIFYLPQPDGIMVIRVLHGARDIERILESET